MLERNEVGADDIVSAFFTVTDDLRSVFRRRRRDGWVSAVSPALRAGDPRRGIDARGDPGPAAVPHGARPAEVKHVYLDGAETLRDDLG
jgi:chorismate mutase